MFDLLRETTLYGLPWWLWGAPTLAGAVGLFLLATRFLGFRNALLAVGAYAMIALTALSHLRGRQAGWEDRQKKDARDAERLVERIKNARRDAANRSPDSLYDDDGFKRK